VSIYSPPKILPVGSRKGQKCPSDRPANGQFFDRCACGRPPGQPCLANGRPPGRPAPTREWVALNRSTARSTGQVGWPCPHSRAHRSTVPVDRLLVRSTVQSTARANWPGI